MTFFLISFALIILVSGYFFISDYLFLFQKSSSDSEQESVENSNENQKVELSPITEDKESINSTHIKVKKNKKVKDKNTVKIKKNELLMTDTDFTQKSEEPQTDKSKRGRKKKS